MSSPRYTPEDAEVAIRALEDVQAGIHEDGCKLTCNGHCDYIIASRALATIRAGAGTACSKCGGKGWYGADGAATPCNSVTCSAAARPGEAKATGEDDDPEHDEWCGDELTDGTILRCNHCNPPGSTRPGTEAGK